MESADKSSERTTSWWREGRRLRPRLECRECEVICERVVSPWHCLQSGRTCVYAYEDGETTYFGCLHKVFAPELDLAAFVSEDGKSARMTDPYGPLRATRTPRPDCPTTVEHAYDCGSRCAKCRNPAFRRGSAADSNGGISVTKRAPAERDHKPRD